MLLTGQEYGSSLSVQSSHHQAWKALMQTQFVWTNNRKHRATTSLHNLCGHEAPNIRTVSSIKANLPKSIARNVASSQRWLCMKQEIASWVANSSKIGQSMGVTLLAAMWAMSLDCLRVTLPPTSSAALATCMHVWQLW